MAADVKVTPRCSLNSSGCVTLEDILISFNAPISEEHAWALCYQCAKCFSNAFRSDRKRCYEVSELDHVLLHKDGQVHPNTVFAGGGTGSRVPVTSEYKMVFCLGLVIFRALDFGLNEEEERNLSPDLERLIDLMTSSDEAPERQETDDEGIERDSGDSDDDRGSASQQYSLARVLELCAAHLSTPQQADGHYRAVCRALVAEALELSSFLEKVSQGTRSLRTETDTSSPDLDKLQFSDWSGRRIWRAIQARLWVQVIRELRNGVKLKKVDSSRTPIEYELTPYEILMDDIRSRRYKLNKVMVDGDIPHRVKKDAHAIILEFIRSRPPLRKASDRKLPPPPDRASSPRELLMESIKQEHRLRPTSSPIKRLTPQPSTHADEEPMSQQPTRRLIKVDFSKLQIDDDDDDDDDIADLTLDSPLENGFSEQHDKSTPTSPSPWHRTAYDLATQCPTRKSMKRRHTIVVCELETQSQPQSRPQSRGPSSGDSESGDNLGSLAPELSWSRSSLQDELLQSKHWQQAVECLSLTLEEVVHIRSVLTKAELESLPVEGHVKEDVEKRKVCFLCLKTRFGIFGPWGQKCKLCKRTVCAKCYSKMRIPTEHFSRVPVFALSPSLSPDEEKDSFPKSFMSRLLAPEIPELLRNSVGSAPSSPNLSRPQDGSHEQCCENGSDEGPQSLPPINLSTSNTSSEQKKSSRAKLLRSKTLGRPVEEKAEKLKGLQMTVCHDCKSMVIQIIKSSRTKRSNAIKNLSLNLSPVY